MSRRQQFITFLCAFCLSIGCSRARLGLPSGQLVKTGAGGSGGSTGMNGVIGIPVSGAGGSIAPGGAGVPSGFSGIGAPPGIAGMALSGRGAGGSGGFGFSGSGGFGFSGSGGVGVSGSGGFGFSGSGGVGVSGGGGFGFSGSGGFPVTGGFGGSAGIPVRPMCQYYAPGNYCMYSDGTSCNQYGCCNLNGNRCCDGTGLCSDPLPPPPPWVPPVAAGDLGSTGWKDNKDTLCSADVNASIYDVSVWSDSRGVFVATTANYAYYYPGTGGFGGTGAVGGVGGDPSCIGCPQVRIMFNDGKTWSEVAGSPLSGQERIRGFDQGPLVLYGYSQPTMKNNMSCGLSTLDKGTQTCQPVDGVTDVSVASSTLAYAALQGDLVRYDSGSWGPVSAVLPGQRELQALWSDPTVVMATGQSAGKIYTLKDNAWKLENTNTLETFTAIFGLSPTDVWAGTQQESLYHYDGSAWKKIDWPGSGCGTKNGILAIWGAGSTVYFATQTALARWNGSAVELVTSWACNTSMGNAVIMSMWGNSATDLFLALVDGTQTRQACGTAFLLNYDGSKFHQM